MSLLYFLLLRIAKCTAIRKTTLKEVVEAIAERREETRKDIQSRFVGRVRKNMFIPNSLLNEKTPRKKLASSGDVECKNKR